MPCSRSALRCTQHLHPLLHSLTARSRLFQQDVDTQLQPILDYLTSLGLDAQHAARMACVYPELLLSSVPDQLQPLVGYLQALGCSSAQAARLLQVCLYKLGGAAVSMGAWAWGGFCWCGCNDKDRGGASRLSKHAGNPVQVRMMIDTAGFT